MKEQFQEYLIKQGYSLTTPAGHPSTVYDYANRLRKTALTRDIERLRREIKQADIDKGGGIADRIDAEKRRADMTKEIKKREQSVFLDGLKIDTELEEQIGKLTADLTARVTRMFSIRIKGANQ